MAATNKCDVCEIEWNPQLQDHRRGPDCVPVIKGLIDAEERRVRGLHRLFQEHADTENQNINDIATQMAKVSEGLSELSIRLDNLAKRVNVIEHPELKKVRSIAAAIKKDN